MKLVIAFCVVMVPGMASAQHRGADTGSGGAAVPAGTSTGSSSSSGGSSSSSSSSGSTSQGSSGDFASARAGHRTGNVILPTNPASSANTTSGTFTNYSNLTFPAPEFSRPRSSLPINTAFPKGSVPTLTLTPTNGNLTFIIGAYNPWLYAYNGLYDMPFYGAFDPFAVDFGYGGSQVWTPSTPAKDEKGVLHLSVKPRDAEVYIDGGLVGSANQFVGLFHKLRLDAGVHRLELRAPGYEPLIVNVRIQAGESMTYRGALEKITP
jgi:PEGA domain